jgi:hypothetical protein
MLSGFSDEAAYVCFNGSYGFADRYGLKMRLVVEDAFHPVTKRWSRRFLIAARVSGILWLCQTMRAANASRNAVLVPEELRKL